MPVYSVIYTIPYFSVFFILLWIAHAEKQGKIKAENSLRWCLAIFVLFFCFRSFVGWDWMAYYPMYMAIDDLFHFTSTSFIIVYSDTLQSELIEPGFILYTYIIKTILDNWFFYVFVTTLIPILAIAVFVKKYSTNYAFSFAIFFALYHGLLIDLMRNSLALSIFLFALVYLKKNNLLVILLITLVGVSFHRTFFILFPFFFLRNKTLPRIAIWSLFAVAIFVFILQIPIATMFLSYVGDYLGDIVSSKMSTSADKGVGGARGFTLGLLIRLVVFIIMMMNYQKICRDRKLIVLFNAYLVYFFISVGVSDIRIIADRMEFVLFFPFIILYPYLARVIYPQYRRVYLLFILLFCFMKTYKYTSSVMLEYQTVFSGITYDEQYSIKHSIADKIVDEQ